MIVMKVCQTSMMRMHSITTIEISL